VEDKPLSKAADSGGQLRDPLLGEMFGRYKLTERLGAGGMGTVYRALDEKLDREVAVKIIHPHLLFDERDVQRFREESHLTAKKPHPNLIHVYDSDHYKGRYYHVMELLEGETVWARIQREGKLPVEEIVRIGVQTATALAHVHVQEIVHRDVKSSNIMLTAGGRAVLMDFGIARADDMPPITEPGAYLGTEPFRAPEQRGGSKCDPRGDIYSLGIVLYHMTTGKLPRRNWRKYRQATAVRPDLPPLLAEIVQRATAIHRNARFSSAEEMKQALMSVPLPESTELAKWLGILSDSDPDRDLSEQVEAAKAIGKLGPKAQLAAPMLVGRLGKFWDSDTWLFEDKKLQEAVLKALGSIGPAARAVVPQLVVLLKRALEGRFESEGARPESSGIIRALMRIDPTTAADEVASLLASALKGCLEDTSGDYSAPLHLINIFVALLHAGLKEKAREAIPALEKLSEGHPDEEIRGLAAQTLELIHETS